MKTHTIKTPTTELLVVELPRVCDYELIKEGLFVKEHGNHLSDYIEGSYTLLGKPDEISEEDAMELVEKIEYDFGTCYRHYTDKTVFARTAKESLLSLLDTEIYWENPIPTPEIQGGYDEFGNFHGGWDDNWISAFEEAEQKTFDKNRTLIFVKN